LKRFLVEVAAFLAIQAAVAIGIESTYRRTLGTHHYLTALRDKERLLQTVPPPRVLLVGGSSLAFGVNSKALERALGVPVLNLGLNAGLGLDMILAQAERGLADGDRVMLSPEYRLLDKGRPFDSATVWQVLAIAPSSARDVSARAVPQLLDDGLLLPRQRMVALWGYARHGRPASVYWRHGFNERGDFVGHLGQASQQAGGKHARVPHPEDLADAVERLSRFARRAHERGAEVVILPAPFPADDAAGRRAAVGAVWLTIAHATGLRVVPAWSPDRSLFWDTEYHLTREGRGAHTREILRALQAPPAEVVASR
jgi:hypothetical protein